MKKILILIVAFAAMAGSIMYTNHLAHQLAEEEHQRMNIWAEATRQFILAEPGEDINFVSSIIEGNTSIPVFMTDQDGRYMFSRNVKLPKRLQQEGREEEVAAYYQKEVDRLRESTEPIEVRLGPDMVQYIYYDESNLLRQLQYLPYIQLLLILAFGLIAAISIAATQRAEKNKVWVGLSKETAHQLGTPISSLYAWNEILKAQYPNDPSFQEIERDIHRLSTITERFSKIGSRPKLTPTAVKPIVEDTIRYMQSRTSSRILYYISADNLRQETEALLAAPLFAWVIENLIKNAVDAMEGEGSISIKMSETDRHILIDVRDTGKGIERRYWRRIFQSGYTTKQRGWGLGLSLAKRIISDYHHGSIYVLHSEIGKGTTFRISLKKC